MQYWSTQGLTVFSIWHKCALSISSILVSSFALSHNPASAVLHGYCHDVMPAFICAALSLLDGSGFVVPCCICLLRCHCHDALLLSHCFAMVVAPPLPCRVTLVMLCCHSHHVSPLQLILLCHCYVALPLSYHISSAMLPYQSYHVIVLLCLCHVASSLLYHVASVMRHCYHHDVLLLSWCLPPSGVSGSVIQSCI